jgi:5,10-methylenetetrahydrofolate reductase
MGLTEKVHILAGVTPLKSGGMARYMAKNVSGIIIPAPETLQGFPVGLSERYP